MRSIDRTDRCWRIDHVGERPPTMNDHRKLHHQQRAAVDRYWRGLFHMLAWEAKVPPLACIGVEVHPMHRDRRSPQDVAACAPAAKAAIDGLVDARVITDDSPAFVRWVLFHQPEIEGRDGLGLTIVEVTP